MAGALPPFTAAINETSASVSESRTFAILLWTYSPQRPVKAGRKSICKNPRSSMRIMSAVIWASSCSEAFLFPAIEKGGLLGLELELRLGLGLGGSFEREEEEGD
jgi:hypothetical protein